MSTWKHHDVSRLGGFSDAVFAFALTRQGSRARLRELSALSRNSTRFAGVDQPHPEFSRKTSIPRGRTNC